ncbi:hypothetical protein BZA05DRAFT_389405 [Tricharina praecox]|uniref:uncharacterized protein n=1 Tax=Tricharina praecox TaxID=43433 RepID=UPI00222099AE|nr:uncharacterized protein BZA05DRAFT_389405 [Tricharina praecox]KAI5855702.1 hypothetical protein BZA05DRAFT_389405 [Tricharina praecox]
MSEYWKSIPKYWCKHCKDFVTDTPLGRKNHDATSKHQNGLKRFLRDIHRDNERAQTATENAKREVERLNAIVSGGSSSTAAQPNTQSVAKPEVARGEKWGAATRALTAEEKKRQMKELEALGVAMPEEFRGDLALPGEWSTVSVTYEKPKMTEKERMQKEIAEQQKKEMDEAERKRKWDELDEDDKEIRSFKIQERTYPGAAAPDVDVDSLFGKGKSKVKVEEDVPVGKPVAFKVDKKEEGIKREDEAEDEGEDTREPLVKRERSESPPGITVKAEETNAPDVVLKKEEEEEEAPAPAASGVVFKKRKAKSMRKKD